MGFIEETGAAQYYRDARITQIYEGTNGIQAIDLVTRKLPLSGGATVRNFIHDLRATADRISSVNADAFPVTGESLKEALGHLERATEWLLSTMANSHDKALAGATPYLRLFGLAAGGCMLADDALAATRSNGARGQPELLSAAANFFATNLAVDASSLASAVMNGSAAISAVRSDILR
jgi:alkylation response protein AidB-like acyl-CoA dehydrogenase